MLFWSPNFAPKQGPVIRGVIEERSNETFEILNFGDVQNSLKPLILGF